MTVAKLAVNVVMKEAIKFDEMYGHSVMRLLACQTQFDPVNVEISGSKELALNRMAMPWWNAYDFHQSCCNVH